MAQREVVPSVRWIGGSDDQKARYWVATYANEGADALAAYIQTLRNEFRTHRNDPDNRDYIASCVRAGKHAVAVYNRHFGAI